MNGITKDGFAYEVDPNVLDDMEFLELLGELEDDVTKLPKVVKALLGQDGKEALYKYLKAEYGRVPVEKATNIIEEIFSGLGEASKNS